MSTNATTIARSATKLAGVSLRTSEIARAQSEAERAERAAADAARAAEAARAAADAAFAAGTAQAAAKCADAALSSARSARDARAKAKSARATAAVASRMAAQRSGNAAVPSDEDRLAVAVERSARYLVTHNGRLLASFAEADDALLFEAELADLDRSHGVSSALCEVRDRRGSRLGGYLVSAGKLLTFLRDEQFERRFGGTARA